MNLSRQNSERGQGITALVFIWQSFLRAGIVAAAIMRALAGLPAKFVASFKTLDDPTEDEGATAATKPPSILRTSLSHVWNRLVVKDVPPVCYAITLVTYLLALLVSLILRPILPHASHLLLFATVVVGAGIGGLRAGVLAIVLALLTFALLPWTYRADHLLLSWSLFTLVALVTGVFCDGLYLARQQVEAARVDAEKTARRSQLLAATGAFLNTTENCEEALESIAQLCVPCFADWCMVDLIDSDGTVRRAAAVHKDRKKADLLYEKSRFVLAECQEMGLVEKVLKTGQPELWPEITADHLKRMAHDEDHLARLQTLGPQSGLCVPLEARGRVLGALIWMSAGAKSGAADLLTPEHRYGQPDMVIANELALRLGLALDNSRLYLAAQQEIAERKRAEAHVHVLNEQLQRSMTETHHRVKNNLQVITAMIDLRLMDGTQTYPAGEFRRLSDYVRTLAMVHDLLTQATKQSGQVHLMSSKSVLEKLLALLRESVGSCELQFIVEDTPLSAKQSTSLALVTNELVSNAIKHGNGEAGVRFCVQADKATLEVYDNGQGFPADFDPIAAANTGLELVESLSRWDLGGQVRYTNRSDGGGLVVVTLPLSRV